MRTGACTHGPDCDCDVVECDQCRDLKTEIERLRAKLAETERLRAHEYRLVDEHKARLRKVVAKLEEKLDILARGFCSPTFDRQDAAIILRDVLAAAQPEEEGPEMTPQDSPDSRPKELRDFEARGFERKNRHAQPEEESR